MIVPVPARIRSGVAIAAAVAVVGVGHTLLRSTGWAYEWRWASFEYQFASLLVAPVLAATASWEGLAARRAGDPIIAAGRVAAHLAWGWLRLMIWAAIGFVGGSLPVVVIVVATRGIGAPPLDALAMFLPALAQLGAVAALAQWAGWRWPRAWIVPASGVAAFVALIGGYVGLPDRLVRVGGATASLLGLSVPWTTQLGQVVLGASVVVLAGAIAWVSNRGGIAAAPRLAVVAAPIALIIGTTMALASAGGPFFVRRPVELHCRRGEPTWCLASDYLPARARMDRAIGPTLDEIRRLGVTPPDRLSQSRRGGSSVDDLLRGGAGYAPWAVVYGWVPRRCSMERGSSIVEDAGRWTTYLDERLAHIRPPAEGAERAELRDAARRIQRCSVR